MNENTAKKKPRFTWAERYGAAAKRKTSALEPKLIEVSDGEVDAVATLGDSGPCGVEDLANGALSAIGQENGVVTERGLRRVRCAVKFLAGLLGGKRHKEALEEADLLWAQVNAFILTSPEFEKMYQTAKGGMKRAMGADVLDTAMEMAVDGVEVHDKEGNPLGYRRRSEKMLDRLLVLSGREFRKDSAGGAKGGGGDSGGKITLNFHFDGKGRADAAEVVNVG